MKREDILSKAQKSKDDEYQNYIEGAAIKRIVFIGVLGIYIACSLVELITGDKFMITFREYRVSLSIVWAFFAVIFFTFYYGYFYIHLKTKRYLYYCIFGIMILLIGTLRWVLF
ncbi:hypothetical protein EDD63_1661 [Breznakia blatticola]|uniref:Uncharacterized protein n=1 Tax=Breznakia blatticola TaxID=1754012 RepID=A0A4R7Z9P2_9FIRM|nr:DUF6442 family protein [Breznakia blatticola]TDW08850.1 hypothetical protein EDD63_1661 [Breznakia blatticola]